MNEYLTWSDEKLIQEGKRLKVLIKQAYAHFRTMPQVTQSEILEALNYIGEIHKGQHTFEQFRNEYKKRYEQTKQST